MSQAEPGGSWDTFCLAGRHAMNMFSIDWQGRLISAFGHPVFPRLPTALGHLRLHPDTKMPLCPFYSFWGAQLLIHGYWDIQYRERGYS